jgi:hypothetical protein
LAQPFSYFHHVVGALRGSTDAEAGVATFGDGLGDGVEDLGERFVAYYL